MQLGPNIQKGGCWKNWSIGSRIRCEVILQFLYTCKGRKLSQGLYATVSECCHSNYECNQL